MKKVTGGTLPAAIWSGFMQAALKGTKPTPLPRAEPIIEPLIAQENSDDNFFYWLGGFFERLFGPDQARTRILPPPQRAQPQPPSPQPRAENTPESPRDRYAYQPRNYYPPREPRARVDRNYGRDRYAYQPQNAYPPPRRGYGYPNDPRYRPRYGYDPRYGYSRDYDDRREDRDPRSYDRRYRY